MTGTVALAPVASPVAGPATGDAPQAVDGRTLPPSMPLGLRARRAFRRYIAEGKLRKRFAVRPYVAYARPVMFLIRTAWCLAKFGPEVAAGGRPRLAQLRDMLRLAWVDGIDPIVYPTLELYRPERRHWADHLLSRFEIGNGLLLRLHKLRPKPHGARVNLGDKMAFHECCRAHGLPSPEILLHAKGGELRWMEAGGEDALDRDLFIKPRQSRGARNSLWLKRVAPFTWRTKLGETWTCDDLLARLKRDSHKRELMLQTMLTNHAEIADLADQSLIAIRVITGMDATETPLVTHAMLRVISKLEPTWRSKREHAATIDLETGRLGLMCNDKDLWPGCWSDDHPVTRAPVAGRLLFAWPEIKALAEAAHRVFSDRMVVGWDIAVTPAGPVILEGNSYADVHFLQRVHNQPIGLSPLGPILQDALTALSIRDRHMMKRSAPQT